MSVNNCPFEGSLEPLKSLSKLKYLYITNTNLSEGLEYLPESLENIRCDSDHSHKSIQIIKELEKHLEGKQGWYYDFPQWLKNKRNSIANSVPLERLYVIRGNLMRFLNKWGAREDEVSEVSKLQDPKEISTYLYLGESGQWIARGAAITGGVIAATTDPILGGVLAAASPAIEVFSTQLKERIYEAQEKKWDAYSEDLEDLLNNYHELLGIIETIVIGEKGKVNSVLKLLERTIQDFLKRYDEDNNQMIDIEELKTKEGKDKLTKDLNKKDNNQLHRIIEAIEGVKAEVINYHRRNEKGTEPLVAKTINFNDEVETNELIIKLQKAETNYQKTKKELEGKKEQSSPNNEEITPLEEKLSELEQGIKGIKEEIEEQEMREKFLDLENWIKNLLSISYINYGSDSLKGVWKVIYEGAGNFASKTKQYLITNPSWYWKQWKNRKEALIKDWKNISSSFTLELVQTWINNDFTLDQTRDWIGAGLKVSDAEFATWLRDTREVNPEWVLNHGQEQYLRQEFKTYLELKPKETELEVEPPISTSKNNDSDQLLTTKLENKKSADTNVGVNDLKKRVGHARNDSDSDLVSAQGQEEKQQVINSEKNKQRELTEVIEDPQEQSSTQAQIQQSPK